MSRLVPLGGDPFAAFSLDHLLRNNPYYRTAAAPQEVPLSQLLPQLEPGEERGISGRLMEGGLGGLAYLGKLADKTFGGRAVRGLLGGNPDELLSVLPLSDTLGITNENRSVSGRQLLEGSGIISPGQPNELDWGDIAGFGAEVALDPSTYFGGIVPKTLARVARPVAAGAARGINAGTRAVAGVAPLEAATNFVANRVVDPVMRYGRAALNPDVRGAISNQGQELGRYATGQLGEYGARNLGEWTDVVQALKPYAGRSQAADAALLDFVRQSSEGVAPAGAAQIQTLGQHFQPRELQHLYMLGRDLRAGADARRLESVALGVPGPELQDEFVQPLARQMQPVERLPGEGKFAARNRIATEGSARHASQIAREDIFRNVPGGQTQLDAWAMDPRFSGAARSLGNTPLQITQEIYQHLNAPGATRKPGEIMTHAEKLTDWLSSLPASHVAGQVPFFSRDVPSNYLTYFNRTGHADTTAKTLYESAGRGFAKPLADLRAAQVDSISLPEMIQKLGLTARDPQGVALAEQHLAQRLNVPLNRVREYGLPADVAQDMVRMNEAWQSPRVASGIAQAWDYVTNLFKGSVTSPFPAFHVRNLFSGVFNMYRGDAIDPIKHPLEAYRTLRDAYELMRGRTIEGFPGMQGLAPADRMQAIYREMIQHRVAFGPEAHGNAADVLGAAGETMLRRPNLPEDTGRSAARDLLGQMATLEKGKLGEQLNPLNTRGAGSDKTQFFLTKAGENVGSNVETYNRVAHYVGLRRQGVAPEKAAEEVMKYQIDYTRATAVEREALRRVAPWYMFSARTLPPILEDLASERAGRLLTPLRAATQLRDTNEFIPPWIAEGASVPIGETDAGQRRYVSGFGLPFEDESLKTLGSLAHGDISRALQQTLGMAVPQIKAPLELAFDKQLYSGRPLEDLKPYEFSTIGGLLPENRARELTQVAANTPLSRAFSSLNKGIDERKGTAEQLVNLFTGARVTDSDVVRAQDSALRQEIEQRLRGRPGVRAATDVYLDRSKLQQLTPEDLLLYKLYADAEQRIRLRAKESRATPP